ncbi:SOS response-associated peptidase family protein [Qipengyuania qiaonensis]|uniref:Abasic site processing protein n=1 Tax=Qipengyuania qiaonensis TaxID=2867240 RepID=A0ABS7J9I7_9SPHN|nr:SOS response-associated peptidase family protein [Qipengyuania qiaonensis]MBX7482971.1 SOS response-associated peptidase [Qipengyuania qiaonensis]
MCNHYKNHPEAISTWAEYIGAAHRDDEFSEIKIDVWSRKQGIVARDHSGERILDTMQWGVPLKMKGKRPGSTVTKRITNVRNLKSPFWRSMLAEPSNRCLVPFNEFAEPKPNAGREECWFKVSDAEVSAFAGIWRETEEGPAYAFLTCEPNPLVAPIHPKAMPVILHPEDYNRWLAGDDAGGFAEPFPSQLMDLTKE